MSLLLRLKELRRTESVPDIQAHIWRLLQNLADLNMLPLDRRIAWGGNLPSFFPHPDYK